MPGNGWTNLVGETSWGPLFVLIAVVIAMCLAPAVVGVRSDPALMLAGGASALSAALACYQLLDIMSGIGGATTTVLAGTPLLLAGSGLSLALLGRAVAASSRAASRSPAPSPASGSTS